MFGRPVILTKNIYVDSGGTMEGETMMGFIDLKKQNAVVHHGPTQTKPQTVLMLTGGYFLIGQVFC